MQILNRYPGFMSSDNSPEVTVETSSSNQNATARIPLLSLFDGESTKTAKKTSPQIFARSRSRYRIVGTKFLDARFKMWRWISRFSVLKFCATLSFSKQSYEPLAFFIIVPWCSIEDQRKIRWANTGVRQYQFVNAVSNMGVSRGLVNSIEQDRSHKINYVIGGNNKLFKEATPSNRDKLPPPQHFVSREQRPCQIANRTKKPKRQQVGIMDRSFERATWIRRTVCPLSSSFNYGPQGRSKYTALYATGQSPVSV